MISKVNTAAQIVLASIVLGGLGLELETGWLVSVMVYAVAATTLVSGGIYVVTWSLRGDLMEGGK
jgi:cardiolipin synthase